MNFIFKKVFTKKSVVLSIIIYLLFTSFLTSYSFDESLSINNVNHIDTTDVNSNDFINELEKEVSSDASSLNINSRNYIVYDRNSNSTIIGKDEDKRVKMASTTKIMTAIVIIENCDLTEIVEVSKKSATTGGSSLGLKTGDKITVNDLLYGLMLSSGNDAAVALAEFYSGSIEEFSIAMNNKAKELNLYNTNFESPHGLDSDNHYTTAYELALLSDYSLKNETFSNIVGTKTYTVNINGYPKTISNTNELLGNLSGVYGIKTGFTNGANRCLVSACKRENMDIICVVLGADTKTFRTKDSIKLIEYTFENFQYINTSEILTTTLNTWIYDNPNYFTIEKGINSNLSIKLDTITQDVLSINNIDVNNVRCEIKIDNFLISPVYKDQIIGTATIYNNTTEVYSVNILSDSNIDKKDSKYYFLDFLKNYFNYLNTISY